MGVPKSQVLDTHMVVIEVTTAQRQERRVSYNTTGPETKYFKMVDKPEEVLRIAGALKDNERILSIFVVNEYGNTFNKTIEFVNGKFKLVDIPEEEI